MASPIGEQMAWYLAAMEAARNGDVPDDVKDHWVQLFSSSDDEERAWWKANAARNNGMTLITASESSDFAGVYEVRTGSGRTFRVTAAVEEVPPHRITEWRWERVHPFELQIREATVADAEALARISYDAAIVVDNVTTRSDYDGDYFAQMRLAGDAKVLIAEIDGSPAAYTWAARHPARIGGVDKTCSYFLHLRVLPEHQKKGLWGELNRAVYAAYPDVDATYGTFSPDNVAWRHEAEQRGANNPGLWRHAVHRFQLAVDARVAGVADSVGDDVGDNVRPATPADAPQIVDLLNAFHGNEELYSPATVDSLTERLERAPDLYSWDRVWLCGDAVMGVWPAGEHVRVLVERDGITTASRRGQVLDYAYRAGAESDLLALVDAWCRWLADRGLTHLSVLAPEASPAFTMLRPLADHEDSFLMMLNPHGLQPPDLDRRGIYFDHVYF